MPTTPFLSKRVSVAQSVRLTLFAIKLLEVVQAEMKGRRFDPQNRQETFSLGLAKVEYFVGRKGFSQAAQVLLGFLCGSERWGCPLCMYHHIVLCSSLVVLKTST
jgi:hypothetical protein